MGSFHTRGQWNIEIKEETIKKEAHCRDKLNLKIKEEAQTWKEAHSTEKLNLKGYVNALHINHLSINKEIVVGKHVAFKYEVEKRVLAVLCNVGSLATKLYVSVAQL